MYIVIQRGYQYTKSNQSSQIAILTSCTYVYALQNPLMQDGTSFGTVDDDLYQELGQKWEKTLQKWNLKNELSLPREM